MSKHCDACAGDVVTGEGFCNATYGIYVYTCSLECVRYLERVWYIAPWYVKLARRVQRSVLAVLMICK